MPIWVQDILGAQCGFRTFLVHNPEVLCIKCKTLHIDKYDYLALCRVKHGTLACMLKVLN
jgi:hypothetical protein